ncbi:Beta-glucosidase 42 [Vitis vinifera]|uniref:Beta-glucosidase 42 n=1 Tax=Vitis vinifera TaxID=29760 RepID=A0A438K1K1_VITVI|nr:Beta-glucosidase 42 [Vitis vinifera]
MLVDGLGTKINGDGIAYYNNLINAFLDKSIEPYITLYHWDLPLYLHWSMRGWLNEQIVILVTQHVLRAFVPQGLGFNSLPLDRLFANVACASHGGYGVGVGRGGLTRFRACVGESKLKARQDSKGFPWDGEALRKSLRFGTERESSWKKVALRKYEEEKGGWCLSSVKEMYGVRVWKAIRRGESLQKIHRLLRCGIGMGNRDVGFLISQDNSKIGMESLYSSLANGSTKTFLSNIVWNPWVLLRVNVV